MYYLNNVSRTLISITEKVIIGSIKIISVKLTEKVITFLY